MPGGPFGTGGPWASWKSTSYVTAKDRIEIFDKDWGSDQPIVFSHGWPRSADDWAHYDGIKAFSETGFTDDLKQIDVPMPVMHGDDDQIVPSKAACLRTARLVKNSTLKVDPGLPRGMPRTNPDQINADMLAFVKG